MQDDRFSTRGLNVRARQLTTSNFMTQPMAADCRPIPDRPDLAIGRTDDENHLPLLPGGACVGRCSRPGAGRGRRRAPDAPVGSLTDGKAFLLKEASSASFFLVGGLHGDNETPALVAALWPSLRDSGYRYIVGEMSPWAAGRLKVPHLRGGDIEEPQPHLLIRDWPPPTHRVGRCN